MDNRKQSPEVDKSPKPLSLKRVRFINSVKINGLEELSVDDVLCTITVEGPLVIIRGRATKDAPVVITSVSNLRDATIAAK